MAMFLAQVLKTYIQRRWLLSRLRTRADVHALQTQQLQAFLDGPARQVPAFADLPRGARLQDFPHSNKASVLADYAAYNCLNLDTPTAWQYVAGAQPPRGFSLGASTGTSGTQGIYLVSDRERAQWLGLMLAKLLPGFWRRPARVAVCLPRNSVLYESARRSHLLKLAFYDLHQPLDQWAHELERFDPTHLIAPPSILRQLASLHRLNSCQVYSAAEVLEPDDRVLLERRFAKVGEIYMATEGVLATSCAHGTLHLTEDAIAFELERVAGSQTLKTPRITDFSRTSQIMMRYEMGDALELGTCTCGSPLLAIKAVHGRCDDAFHLDGKVLTPDILRNTVMAAAPAAQDYRLTQTGPNAATLEIDAPAAMTALTDLFAQWGVTCELSLRPAPLNQGVPYKKRRRIQGLGQC